MSTPSSEKWAGYDAARTAVLHAIGEKIQAARERQDAALASAAKARSTQTDPFTSAKDKQLAHADQIAAATAFTRIDAELRALAGEQASALRGDHPALGAALLRARMAEQSEQADATEAAEAALRAAMRSAEVQAALTGLAAQQGRAKALQRAAEFLAA